MKNFKGFLWVLLWASVLGSTSILPAHARDLQGRLGVGFNGQFANSRELSSGTPAMSFKYGFTKDIATEAVVGFATGTGRNNVLGLKFFKNLFFETSLNFYYMLAAGAVKAGSESGTDFQTGFGAEFFIPGIESVGWSFETGVELTNLTGTTVFRTLGLSFLHAGMRFYF